MKKVFIDGSAGTTGLRIAERLAARADIELLCLPEESRKDPACRRQMLNEADIAFFCLPDAAALLKDSLRLDCTECFPVLNGIKHLLSAFATE